MTGSDRPRSGRRKVLLAPVTVTPAKPLTPSHLKGLLWTDVMFRATAPLADVTYHYSPTAYHLTEQTLGFWEFLDRTQETWPTPHSPRRRSASCTSGSGPAHPRRSTPCAPTYTRSRVKAGCTRRANESCGCGTRTIANSVSTTLA